LSRLAHLKTYGIASAAKHDALRREGALPIDYRTQDVAATVRRAEPQGVDVVIDGMNHLTTITADLAMLRQGGRVVGYGEPPSRAELARLLGLLVRTNLRPGGKRIRLYGTSNYFLFDRRPFEEDWAILFRLLQQREICPVIAARLPLLEAAAGNRLLESGAVVGNVVLLAPEWLTGAGLETRSSV
jgi:NADPH:quinone reductase-like Zn-dependent oxidoreductase